MACKDCGQQARAVQPCRTFTFPLGTSGEVDLVFRGSPTQEDITEGLPAFADFAMHAMTHLVPKRGEQAPSPPQTEPSRG